MTAKMNKISIHTKKLFKGAKANCMASPSWLQMQDQLIDPNQCIDQKSETATKVKHASVITAHDERIRACLYSTSWSEQGRLPTQQQILPELPWSLLVRWWIKKLEEFTNSAQAESKVANTLYACGLVALCTCDDLFSANGILFAMKALSQSQGRGGQGQLGANGQRCGLAGASLLSAWTSFGRWTREKGDRLGCGGSRRGGRQRGRRHGLLQSI